MKPTWKATGPVLVFVLLYVLIGNARSIEPNPFMDGGVIAVYMVVPVIAGILFGMRTGLLVGLVGTAINAGIYQLYDADRALFEYLAILPHSLMGTAAGWLRGKMPTPFIAPTIFIGHALNVTAFLLTGKMDNAVLMDGSFWLGLGYEGLLEIVTIIIMITIYRLGFPEPRS